MLTKDEKKKLMFMMEALYEVTGVLPQMYMNTKSKENTYVRLRQIAAYCLRKNTKLSLKDIGILQGYRDHSTIIHSCNKVEDWLSDVPGYSEEKELINEIFQIYGKKCEAYI